MKTFCAVVQEKGFRRAADKLYISQASVSQHVFWLERHFGLSLFERRGRSVALTPQGKVFYGLAMEVLGKIEELPRSLEAHEGLSAGSLELALTLQIYSPLFAAVVSAFREQYPNVALTVHRIREGEESRVIQEGGAEILFTERKPGETLHPELTGLDVLETPLVLVGSACRFDCREGGSCPLEVKDLNELDFVVFPEGTALRTFFEDFVLDNQLRPRSTLQVDDPCLAFQLAETGGAVVLVGRHSVEPGLARRSLVCLEPPKALSLYWQIQAVYHAYRGLSFAGWAFLRLLRGIWGAAGEGHRGDSLPE